jgi:hypothetical protein
MVASIAQAIIIIAVIRPRRATTRKAKMGSLTAPHFLIGCVVSKATHTARLFSGDAHRKSGVFQLWFGSKPGGVMLPPELDELTPLIYSYAARGASE